MTEKNYVVNVKTKLGTIFTVRGDTAEELATNIGSVVQQGINDHVGALEELLLGATVSPAVASAVDTVVASLGGAVIEEAKFAPKAPPSSSSAVGGKTCVHGGMVKRTGNGAKGEWRGFFCPTPKGTDGQCSPVFARQGSAEWQSF
jgi:hypothetical protein